MPMVTSPSRALLSVEDYKWSPAGYGTKKPLEKAFTGTSS